MKKVLAGVLVPFLVVGAVATSAEAGVTDLPPRPSGRPGACLASDGQTWNFPVDQILPPYLAIDKCKDAGGAWFTAAQYDAIRTGRGVFFVPTDGSHGRAAATAAGRPADWYAKPAECAWLPSTRSTTGDNLLMDVHIAESVELLLQGLYNSGSNEFSGLAGIFLGIALSGAQAIRYEVEWRYELQEECQETVMRSQVKTIAAGMSGLGSLGTIGANAATAAAEATDNGLKIDSISGRVDRTNTRLETLLDTSVGSRASQASLNDLRSVSQNVLAEATDNGLKIDSISGRVDRTNTRLETLLDTSVGSRASQASLDDLRSLSEVILSEASRTLAEVEDQIDTNIGSRASQRTANAIMAKAETILAAVVTNLDVNVGSRASQESVDNLTTDLRADVAALRAEMEAESRRSVDLFIEEHLQSCTALAVFLIDEGPGLQSETFAAVGALMTAFGDRVPDTATTSFRRAERRRDSGDFRGAFQNLCNAYQALANA